MLWVLCIVQQHGKTFGDVYKYTQTHNGITDWAMSKHSTCGQHSTGPANSMCPHNLKWLNITQWCTIMHQQSTAGHPTLNLHESHSVKEPSDYGEGSAMTAGGVKTGKACQQQAFTGVKLHSSQWKQPRWYNRTLPSALHIYGSVVPYLCETPSLYL